MRILHVITSLVVGGAERLMVDLLPLLRDRGHHDVELLLFNGMDTAFREELHSYGIVVHELSSDYDIRVTPWRVYNPWNIIKLRQFLRGYDIIHTHNTACQLFLPVAKCLFHRNVKLVTTEHSSNNRRRTKRWLKPIDRWMYNRYAAVVCISDKSKQNLEYYLGKSKDILIICNGVDIQRFIHPIKDVTCQQKYIIIMVARLRVEKDHETVLRAMLHLPVNYSLWLVGDGVKADFLKSMATDLGVYDRVAFMGDRQDVPDILEQSDIVVLSSHWEGLSLSSIEGMASGRPFIASDVDGLHEMVDGAGVLFPQGDDVALASSIKELCENPDLYRKIAESCQERSKCYDISVMADGYLDLYQKVLMN